MPKKEETFNVSQTEITTILAISHAAFRQLGWKVEAAAGEKLAGSTKGNPNKGETLLVTAGMGSCTISSELNGSASFDMMGKNKKNIAAFIHKYQELSGSMRPDDIIKGKALITSLQQDTIEQATAHAKTAEEIDAVMNFSKSNLWLTYGLIAINLIMFIVTLVDGSGLMGENAEVIVKWGGNYAPLTLSGDWWRLASCMFLHFGIIHVGMNMYALYMAGVYLEPMLGKRRFIVAYLCTGVIASVTSLWWHIYRSQESISAGASGAIFGMYGVFLALLTTNLIPKQLRSSLLQSIGIFVAYNLLYGAKGNVDNAAHLGGLVSGFVIGFLFYFDLKKERTGLKLQWVIPLIIIATAGVAFMYVNANKVSAEQRQIANAKVNNQKSADIQKFIDNYNRFVDMQNVALAPLKNTALDDAQLADSLQQQSLPQWQMALKMVDSMKTYNVSYDLQKKATLTAQYIDLRIAQCNTLLRLIANNDHENQDAAEAIVKRIDSTLNAIEKIPL